MKIMDIISEQEETNYKMVEFKNLLEKIKKDLWFKKDLKLSSGTGYMSYTISSNGLIFEVNLVYNPDHVNPIIPSDLFKVAGDEVINLICSAKGMSKNELVQYFGSVLDNYSIHIHRTVVFLMEGVFDLKRYMDNNIYNMKIDTPHLMRELFRNENLYQLLPEQLPRFSEDYATTMSKLIKKCKTIYMAMGKGTWKGHIYDYGKFNQSNIVVHQKDYNYNKRDKILNPDFDITYGASWPTIDGIKFNTDENPLTGEERDEFKNWLESKFKHFGIDFKA